MHEIPGKETAPSQEQVQEELGEHGPRLVEAIVAMERTSRQEREALNKVCVEYSEIKRGLSEVFNEYDQWRVDELYRRFQEAEVAYCSGCVDMRDGSDVENVLAIGWRAWMVTDCMSRKSGVSPAQELHRLCGDCRENPEAEGKRLPASDQEEGVKLFAAEVSDEGLITYRDEDNVSVTISSRSVEKCDFSEHEDQFRIFSCLPVKIEPWAEGIPPSIHKLQEMHYDHTYNPGGRPLAYVGGISTPAANTMLQELRNQHLCDS